MSSFFRCVLRVSSFPFHWCCDQMNTTPVLSFFFFVFIIFLKLLLFRARDSGGSSQLSSAANNVLVSSQCPEISGCLKRYVGAKRIGAIFGFLSMETRREPRCTSSENQPRVAREGRRQIFFVNLFVCCSVVNCRKPFCQSPPRY